jgi:hypothetical protein
MSQTGQEGIESTNCGVSGGPLDGGRGRQALLLPSGPEMKQKSV